MKQLSKNLLFGLSFLVVLLLIENCNDATTPPTPTNDSELITSVKMEFQDSVTGKFLNFFFRDLDGIGGNAPTQWDTIMLDSGHIYIGGVRLLNESNPNNIINVTAEIKSEEKDHIICYTPSLAGSIIKVTDSDGAFPLGIETKWNSNKKGLGTVTITLKHQPGIKNGACSNGETDVEVIFPLKIK